MFVLVLAAEADETRQAITFLIVCLVGIAVMLSALTAWYWHHTSPKRQPAAAPGLVVDPQDDPAVGPSDPQPPPPLVGAAPIEGSSVPAAVSAAGGEAAEPELVIASVEAETVGRSATVVGPSRGSIEAPERAAALAAMSAGGIEGLDRRADRAGAPPVAPSSVGNGRATEGGRAAGSTHGSGGRRGQPAPVGRGPGRPPGDGPADRDEPVEARRAQDREADVLSDEDWAAVMKSAFDKMYQ